MKYNKNTKTEKPENECPRTCGECEFFRKGYGGGTCTANGCNCPTYAFSSPTNRPLPQPLNCYWWYNNYVLSCQPADKQDEYAKERLHLLTAHRYLQELDGDEKKAFIKHCHRESGGGLIDFAIYPRAFKILQEIKKL